MNHRATYSADDNKLRLYPACRLDTEEYKRVKAAGFAWAPKQELFVAPMWTPGREDLLLEMCGEIEDEDTSLVERAEDRADRFTDYSEKRMDEAERTREAVSRLADAIPLGQPILVGHHSEKHARKDAERIQNGMSKAVRLWQTSKYWKERAAGAIGAAKYKELPAVRARRIKGLEADQRKWQRTHDEWARNLKVWETIHDDQATTLKRKDGTTGTFLERARYFSNLDSATQFTGIDGTGSYSAWDILRPDEERYKNCPKLEPSQVQERVIKSHIRGISRCDRWLAHIENRLTYERAMLEADGGTVADRTKPEAGGGCRCWCSPRNGWSYIQKVNRVSVTVLDNWGNGGANFTRTMPFDKLAGVMSRAEVEQARAAGRLVESHDKRGFHLTDAPPAQPKPAPKPDAQAEKFEALKAAASAGVQVVTAPHLFPTPPNIAAQMVELAGVLPSHQVLEPSAGTGALTFALWQSCKFAGLCAVEKNLTLVDRLRESYPFKELPGLAENCGHSNRVIGGDFLEMVPEQLGQFDRVLMNPPFERGSDIKHILHALRFLKPGGRLVAICANGPRQNEQLRPLVEKVGGTWEPLPDGTFSEQGTNVNTVLLCMDNPPKDSVTTEGRRPSDAGQQPVASANPLAKAVATDADGPKAERPAPTGRSEGEAVLSRQAESASESGEATASRPTQPPSNRKEFLDFLNEGEGYLKEPIPKDDTTQPTLAIPGMAEAAAEAQDTRSQLEGQRLSLFVKAPPAREIATDRITATEGGDRK